MQVSDFYYDLPEELIAQEPILKRDESRLLVLSKKNGQTEDKTFRNIIDYFEPGDCLVLNDTKVIPARLIGEKENTGGKIEFVLLKDLGDDKWETLVKPGRRAIPGARFSFGRGKLKAEVLEVVEGGNRIVRFEYEGIFNEILDSVGAMPLPPYIHKQLEDKDRYQTVYSNERGSAAAPTAGLHFTKELLAELEKKGVDVAYVTLHVGLGTFRPVKVDKIEDHTMHTEHYKINQETCDKINKAKQNGKRVISVGTTSTRVLESVTDEDGVIRPKEGDTGIFIYPGYKFKMIDGLITNFHLPESTLIMLVSAFAGYDNVMAAYKHAVEDKYRFFSFGDAMLII